MAPGAVACFLPLVTDTLSRLAPETEPADAASDKPVKKKRKDAEKSAEGAGVCPPAFHAAGLSVRVVHF